jgi:sn-glycerol 3-phosphate transport system ATP-binding protein
MNLLKNAPDALSGIITGVRPEHLEVTETGWALRVETVEMLGAERLVYGRWTHGSGDEMVIVRIEEGHPVPTVGSTICVTPRAHKIHYFDAGTGKRVQADSRAGQ